MTGIRILLIGLALSFLFSSCGAKKSSKSAKIPSETTKPVAKSIPEKRTRNTKTVAVVSSSNKKDISTIDYIDQFSDIAVNQMRIHHIPASITLAQGILESRSGNSDLTRVSNNHFGIKCHKGWKGARTYYDDDKKGECFRVYEYATNSYNDHSRFLVGRKRYSSLFKLGKSDYKAWAKGLQKAGYATDKRYPQKLISIIEKYELYKYDEIVLGKTKSKAIVRTIPNPTIVSSTTNPLIYVVKKGDGLYGISRKFRIELKELKSINNLDSNTIYPGQKLYLKAVDDQTNQVKIVDNSVNKVLAIDNSVKHVSAIDDQTNQVKSVDNSVKQVNAVVHKVEQSIPEVDRDTIPPPVKKDTIKQLVQKEQPSNKPDYHIVQKGETLYQIAYKYDLAIPEFRRWNRIRKDEIKIGQRLLIQNPNKEYKTIANQNTHIVSRGETLYYISKKYGITIAELRLLNNLEGNTISVGQVLLIK